MTLSTENLATEILQEKRSKDEFDNKDEALTDALDNLENEVCPPKAKPEPIGGMF